MNMKPMSMTSRSHNKTTRSVNPREEMKNRFIDQFEKQAQQTVIKNSLDNDPDLKWDDPTIYTYDKKLE